MSDLFTPYTIASWAVVIGIGIVIYKQYTAQTVAKVSNRVQIPKKELPARKEAKLKKPREKRDTVVATPTPTQTKPAPAVVDTSEDDEKIDNKEFAKQLTNAKLGTKFSSKKADEKKTKSVKQSRAQEIAPGTKQSPPSSTTGVDADDDQSFEASPVMHATDAGNVSDMLEAPAPGPKSLRVTGTSDADTKKAPKAAKAAKAPEPKLTKKQRQNKKKAEEAKAAREEDEKDRKVKLEAQRRLARESEGRAAKDGSAFMASLAQNNAWTEKKASNEASAPAPAQLLDTFEVKPAPAAPAAPAGDNWMSDLPSEEEQIERAMKETLGDEWSTVESKKSKNKNKKKDTATNTTSPAELQSGEAKPPATKSNGASAKSFASQSSFAALSSGAEEPAASKTPDEEEEEEWDV